MGCTIDVVFEDNVCIKEIDFTSGWKRKLKLASSRKLGYPLYLYSVTSTTHVTNFIQVHCKSMPLINTKTEDMNEALRACCIAIYHLSIVSFRLPPNLIAKGGKLQVIRTWDEFSMNPATIRSPSFLPFVLLVSNFLPCSSLYASKDTV